MRCRGSRSGVLGSGAGLGPGDGWCGRCPPQGAAEPPAVPARGRGCSWGEAPPAPGLPNAVFPYPGARRAVKYAVAMLMAGKSLSVSMPACSLFCKILTDTERVLNV